MECISHCHKLWNEITVTVTWLNHTSIRKTRVAKITSQTCNAQLLPVLTQPAVEQEWLDVTRDWVWTCTYANTGPFLHSSFQVNIWECNGCTIEIRYNLITLQKSIILWKTNLRTRWKIKGLPITFNEVFLWDGFYQIIELHPENKLY